MLLKLWLLVKPHVWYWVLIAGGLLAFHSWLREHDARLLAEQQIQASEAKVTALQQERQQRDAQATQAKELIIREVHDAVTPQQQLSLLPQLSDVPLNAVPVAKSPDLPDAPSQVKVDLQPLVQELSTCKQNAIALGACQSDLRASDSIAFEKDKQITILKKKPGFWHSFGRDLKMIGCGALGGGIGSQIGKRPAVGATIGAGVGAGVCSFF